MDQIFCTTCKIIVVDPMYHKCNRSPEPPADWSYEQLRKAYIVEKEWVQALTEDNGHLIARLDEHDIPLPTGTAQEKLRTCTIAHDHFRPGTCWGCIIEDLHKAEVGWTEAEADIEELENVVQEMSGLPDQVIQLSDDNHRLFRLVKKLLPLRRLRPAVTAAEKLLATHDRLLRHLASFGSPEKGDQLAQEQQSWLLELEAAVQYARE